MKRANKNNTTFQDFDVCAFLDHYDIVYRKGVKNVGHGWIGLDECPFCGIGGWHFGINEQSSGWHCWACQEKGTLFSFIKEVLHINGGEASKIIKDFWNSDLEFTIRETGQEVILPSGLKPVSNAGKKYLKDRDFNPEYIIKKYQLQEFGAGSFLNHVGIRSDFQYRLYIPIIMYKELVSYTARDYTKQRDPRYQHPFLEAIIIPPSSCIYNIDTVKEKAIILEGPTDVWRMGDECISLQGIETTKEQIRYLVEMGVKEVTIMFDAGKDDKAKKIAYSLSGIIPKVKVASLDKGDPGELSDEDAIKIKAEILK